MNRFLSLLSLTLLLVSGAIDISMLEVIRDAIGGFELLVGVLALRSLYSKPTSREATNDNQ